MKHCSGSTDTVMTQKQHLNPTEIPHVIWKEESGRRYDFLKNLVTASALLICVVMLRGGAVPGADSAADAVLASARQDTLLNDELGKLTFVSTLFPESVLVFGESRDDHVTMPVNATAMIHSWRYDEPYAAWASDGTNVFAAVTGEVAGVYHGMDEELIVQITNDRQLSCIVGNLTQVTVATGDHVTQGELIGNIGEGSYCTFEVQQDGRSIDPAFLLEAP